MKKAGILLLALLLLSMFSVVLVKAQTPPIPNLPGTSGSINPETGLPTEFDKFQEIGEQLSEEEKRKAYLRQEWTKILSKNKYIGPFLFYTNKFFSFFNPLWKYTLGIEFIWSWAFFIALVLWIFVIVIIYRPVRDMLSLHQGLSFIISFIIASLAAHFGMEPALNLLTKIFINWIFITVFICLVIIGIILYWIFSKKFAEKLKEEKKKQAEGRRESKQELLEDITDIKLKGQGIKNP